MTSRLSPLPWTALAWSHVISATHARTWLRLRCCMNFEHPSHKHVNLHKPQTTALPSQVTQPQPQQVLRGSRAYTPPPLPSPSPPLYVSIYCCLLSITASHLHVAICQARSAESLFRHCRGNWGGQHSARPLRWHLQLPVERKRERRVSIGNIGGEELSSTHIPC
jgi:hypothetical protein